MRTSKSNMEHYRNEILEILKDGYHDFSIREDGSLASCGGMNCDKCVFSAEKTGVKCCKAKTLWLMEDYKPEITLTAREKHFVEFAESGYIARDCDGGIWWHEEKPAKDNVENYWNSYDGVLDIEPVGNMFLFITWEDEEPWAVEDLRKLRVEDGKEKENH